MYCETVRDVVLLGNEAVAYGALESGVRFASAYPGTPSTEIIETLAKLVRKYNLDVHVEWSVNEKVAFEAAYGAAIAGVNSIVAMKHVGLNVALDPFTTSAYTGVEASLVVVSADDPNMWSSQNEQDNRWFGIRSYIPVLEPGYPAEIKDITLEAFKFSRSFKHPVLLRLTTRLSHSRAIFKVCDPPYREIPKMAFKKNPDKYSVVPSNARRLRRDLIERWSKMEDFMNRFRFNWIEEYGSPKHLIICSGSAYGYVKDAVNILKVGNIRILKLSGIIPLPKKLLLSSIDGVEDVLIVEELEPIVETIVKKILYEEDVRVPVYGKEFIPLVGELTLENVLRGLAKYLNLEYPYEPIEIKRDIELPPRPPVLCPGCPYRSLFYMLKRVISKVGVKPVYNGDIGCYSLAIYPPFRMQDTIVEMGGSIGLANGFSYALKGEFLPIAIIGDSTFYHSGITPLLNSIYNNTPVLVIILDNRITAMTGHQPHPGSGFNALGGRAYEVKIEDIVKSLGVKMVTIIDPYNIKDSESKLYNTIKYVVDNNETAVIISRRTCALLINSTAIRRGIELPLCRIDPDKCRACGICYKAFACPAIIPMNDDKAHIDEALCVGCGVCIQICPYNAIEYVRPWSNDYKALWGEM